MLCSPRECEKASELGKFTWKKHFKDSLVGILCSSLLAPPPFFLYFGFRKILIVLFVFFFFKPLVFWWFLQFYFLLVDLITYIIIFGSVHWIRKGKKDKWTFSRINHDYIKKITAVFQDLAGSSGLWISGSRIKPHWFDFLLSIVVYSSLCAE